MIRTCIEVHCDAPGCAAMTLASGVAYTSITPFGGDILYKDIRFPSQPDGSPSKWYCGNQHLCEEHREDRWKVR